MFNCAAVTTSKMKKTSRYEGFAVHSEMLNGFKGLLLFFHTMTPSIALTSPENTEVICCLEERELKNAWSS